MTFRFFSILLFAFALQACGGSSATLDVAPADTSTDDRLTIAGSGEQTESADTSEDDQLELQPAITPPLEFADGVDTITDVVLITGQSNALGSQTVFDPVLDAPVDRFFAYTDEGWRPATLRQVWDLGSHPLLGLGDDPHNNFGFYFGKTLVAQRSDRVVGIILVTAPGEGISHWDADSFFFRKIRNKALLALNELPHKTGVDGILWHQGETDWASDGSNDPDIEGFPPNDYYSNRLSALISNFRIESWYDAGRPFICGETARSPINVRLNGLNRDSDSYTACVPGEGLPTWDEQAVHFNAEGLRQLGANYAEVYLQMTQ